MLPMTPTPEQLELRRRLAAGARTNLSGALARRTSRYLTDGTGRVVKIGGRP